MTELSTARAFYEPDGKRFMPTAYTRGPWSPEHQHAGPPAALLTTAIEAASDIEGSLARVTFEILKPARLVPLRIAAQVVRPGRNVELIEAELSDDDGPVMLARAWRFAKQQAPTVADRESVPPAPGQIAVSDFLSPWAAPDEPGYHSAVELRFIEGSFFEPGPAKVWMGSSLDLIAGRETSALEHLMVVADSGNGVSQAINIFEYEFMNTELTVHLHRQPVGECFCLDAQTLSGGTGLGMAETALWDPGGRLGRAAQSLLIRRRRT